MVYIHANTVIIKPDIVFFFLLKSKPITPFFFIIPLAECKIKGYQNVKKRENRMLPPKMPMQRPSGWKQKKRGIQPR